MKVETSKLRLGVLPPEEDGYTHADCIPKYGLAHDSRFFYLDSLVRMYGKKAVESFFRTSGFLGDLVNPRYHRLEEDTKIDAALSLRLLKEKKASKLLDS